MLKFKCPIESISEEEFQKLKKKYQAYIVMVYEWHFTDQDIMDRLFIDNRWTYWSLKKKMRSWITKHAPLCEKPT